jgi:bla regulator protein blaR1
MFGIADRPKSNRAPSITLVVGGLCHVAFCQTAPPVQPDKQPPSYEVATIKPSDAEHSLFTLRMYIVGAFGINGWSNQQLIGPEWIDKASYEIQGKTPGSLREAMSKMTRDQRVEQMELVDQSLLVDRFKLKYHFEMREMQVYELVVAKGGLKMKERIDQTKKGVSMNPGGRNGILYGVATIPDLAGLLTNAEELKGKPIINQTGLSGTFYDFSLKWTSSIAADSTDNAEAPADANAPSIFTALEEQLGLKLVVARAPAKVVVIDHIEPPSPN